MMGGLTDSYNLDEGIGLENWYGDTGVGSGFGGFMQDMPGNMWDVLWADESVTGGGTTAESRNPLSNFKETHLQGERWDKILGTLFGGDNLGQGGNFSFEHNLGETFIDPLFTSDVSNAGIFEREMKEKYEFEVGANWAGSQGKWNAVLGGTPFSEEPFYKAGISARW